MPRPRRPFIVAGQPYLLDAPGLSIIRGVAHWVAPKADRDAGYRPRTVQLHFPLTFALTASAVLVEGALSELEKLAARCRTLQAEADQWRSTGGRDTRPVYDGTLHSLIECYQRDSESPFRTTIGDHARRGYSDWCAILDAKFGARRIDRLVGRDIKRWFVAIAAPSEPGGKPPLVLAKRCVRTMLSILLNYGGTDLGLPDCLKLYEMLRHMEFRVSRELRDTWRRMKQKQVPMTYAHAEAIVAAGLARGTRRHRSLAIGTAAQFELTLAQVDIIGQWPTGKRPETLPEGAVVNGTSWWRPGLRYEDFLPGMALNMARSKNNRAGAFDVREYPLFMRALAAVPEAERTGAVAINEQGLPFNRRSYSRIYGELATEAKVPKGVWNMNARHGGANEADEAGVPLHLTSQHLQHSGTEVTKRHYIEPSIGKTRKVARARVAHRLAENT